jgi:hypothetical protein
MLLGIPVRYMLGQFVLKQKRFLDEILSEDYVSAVIA